MYGLREYHGKQKSYDCELLKEGANNAAKLFEEKKNVYEIYREIKKLNPVIADTVKDNLANKSALRKAYIEAYIGQKGAKVNEANFAKVLNETFDIKKYAVVMNKQDLLQRMYGKTYELLANQKSFKEVFKVCQEYIERADSIPEMPQFLPIFNVPGVKEIIELMTVAASFKADYQKMRGGILNYFRKCLSQHR